MTRNAAPSRADRAAGRSSPSRTDDTAADAAAPGPLHRRILSDITRKIVSGTWPPGHRIPFEQALSEQYQCSRMTVNKALTELAKTGLIERRRRSGSFVRQPRSQAAILEIHDVATEVHSLGLPYRYELTARRVRKAAAEDAAMVDVLPDTPLIELCAIHFAGERPFCLEQRLINLTAVPEAESADFARSAPGAWLIAQVPWSAAEHRIRAAAAARLVAKALDIARGTPCQVIERHTWSGGQAITSVRLTYPGESHVLVARFTPSRRQPPDEHSSNS